MAVFNEIRRAAEKGDAEKQFKLACAYFYETGMTESAMLAVKWLRLSAAQGYLAAQCFLGTCYYDGEGVAQSDVDVVEISCSAMNFNCTVPSGQ